MKIPHCHLAMLFVVFFAGGAIQSPAQVPAPAPPPPEMTGKALQSGLGELIDAAFGVDGTIGKPVPVQGEPPIAIPLPTKLAKVESALNRSGENADLEAFKQTLVKAASSSWRKAAVIFKQEGQELKTPDPLSVLNGGPTALTDLFKQQERGKIRDRLLSVISSNAQAEGVDTAYQNFVARTGLLANKLSPPNWDQYLTDQTIDYAFDLLARGEAALRMNPGLSANPLVRKVFNAAQ